MKSIYSKLIVAFLTSALGGVGLDRLEAEAVLQPVTPETIAERLDPEVQASPKGLKTTDRGGEIVLRFDFIPGGGLGSDVHNQSGNWTRYIAYDFIRLEVKE